MILCFFSAGNRPGDVEKNLKKSLADLNLEYVDMYLIHVPFAFPASDEGMMRHPNGDVVLDETTDHVAIWKVRISGDWVLAYIQQALLT